MRPRRERERYFITATYESWVTGNLDKAQQTCETWAQVYPSEMIPHTYLSGFIYPAFGKYEKAIDEGHKASNSTLTLPSGIST